MGIYNQGMKTKYYHIIYGRIGSVMVFFLILLLVFVLIAPLIVNWMLYILKGLVLYLLIISILLFITITHQIGINDEHLVVITALGKFTLPWEDISDFYPLYTPAIVSVWAVTSPDLPFEYKLLGTLSTQLRKPHIIIRARTDEQIEMLAAIQEKLETVRLEK